MAGGRLISHGINAEEWKKCVPIMPYGLIDEYFAADYASSMPKSLRRAELELLDMPRPPRRPPAVICSLR